MWRLFSCEHRQSRDHGHRNHFRPVGEQMDSRVLLSTLAAPSFTATVVSATQINLAWTRVAGASRYLVDEWVKGAWAQIGSLGSGSTRCAVTGLSPQTYWFDVGALNGARTTWAQPKSATTVLTPPASPSFTATAVSATQIKLAWTGVAGATGYLVDEWVNGAWARIGSLGSGSTGCAVTGLSPNATYTFDVAAYNAAGTTWANYQSATTFQNSVAGNHPAAETAYSPVSGSLFGANGLPSYRDVQQGAVGDCWLLSSLAEVAARYPSDIENMFTDLGSAMENGSAVELYNVRFFNNAGVPEYVTVDTELPSGGGYYDQPANSVLWVALAEKAYAEANGEGFVTTSSPGSDSYNALDGGQPSWALQAITGKSASSFAINPTNIAAAWNAGELIVLGSSSAPASPYIVGDAQETHAYAVVNYTASSSMPFEVYNPWGADSSGWALGLFNGQKVYGLFFASAGFLSQNFATQSVTVNAMLSANSPDRGAVANTSELMAITVDTSSIPSTHESLKIVTKSSTPIATPASPTIHGRRGASLPGGPLFHKSLAAELGPESHHAKWIPVA